MYSPFRHIPALIGKQLVQLTVFLTRRCNAHCPYCFYLQANHSDQNNPDELTLSELQSISNSTGRLLWLAFSGGEIFLRKDLVEISRAFYENNQPVYMLYPTNGLMPRRVSEYISTIAAQCPKSHIVVKLSIDGLYEKHDQLRQTPGSFEKTLQTYSALNRLSEKYQNLQIGVNTVFCSDNQDQMPEIERFVNSLSGIQTHTVSLVRGDLKQERYKQVDMTKYLQTSERLAKRIYERQTSHYRFVGGELKIAQDILQRDLIGKTLTQGQRQTPCYAGRSNIVLSETGEVYPCEILSQSLGNIRDHELDFPRFLSSKNVREQLQSLTKSNCFCSHECHMMTNILANPKWYIPLVKEWLKIKAA